MVQYLKFIEADATVWVENLALDYVRKSPVDVPFVVGAGATYEHATEYTCTVKAGVTVEEFRVSSRTPTIDDETLRELLEGARAAGVPNATIASVSVVDFSDC